MKSQQLKKICPECKHEFVCIIDEPCWCEKIFISRENLIKMRRKYMDCLCEKCLKKFSVSEN